MSERSPNPMGASAPRAPNAIQASPFGRHFTAAELAEIWKLDETTIRRLFQDEPGVLKIGKSNRRDGKRDYITLRIPEAVAVRVYEQRSK